MTHQGYWQQRLEGWLNQMVLSSENNSVSFLDQKNDDVFKAIPLPAENFKPLAAEPEEIETATKQKKVAEKEEESFTLQPEPVEFKYKIASKVLENEVRVVANAKGFYLSLRKNHYELIKPFASGQIPSGSIWMKKASMVGWYEIVHNYYGTETSSIGFIRISNGEVTFKEDLYVAGKTKYKLY